MIPQEETESRNRMWVLCKVAALGLGQGIEHWI